MSKEELEMIRPMLEDCQKKEGITDDQLNEMIEKESMDTREAKCMGNCMMKTLTFVSNNSILMRNY